MLGSSDCDWATSQSQTLSSRQMTPTLHQHRPVLSQLKQENEGSTATTVTSTSIISTGHEEFPGSSQGTQFQISTPALGVPGSVAQPIQFPPGVQIPVSGFTVGRLPMASQAIPGQVKLEAMTQLQHPGMFPHAYIIPNGHAAQEFVQAQQVIGQQVVGAPGQVPPPPPVEGTIPGQLHMQNGQQMVMVDPNAVPGSHGVMPPATVAPISSTANTLSDDIGNATTSTSSDGTAASQVGDQSSAQGKRLHVSNIPFRFRDPDLRTMFGKHGKIADVEIIFNERGSKGFGFITFETREGAECAKKALNGTIVEGRKVEVNDATARVQTKKPTLPLINGLKFAPMMPNLIATDPYAAAIARLNPIAANAYRQAALLGGRGRSIYQTTALRPGTAIAAPAAVQGNGLFPLVYESYPTMALAGAMHAGGQEFSQGQTFWAIPGLTAQGTAGAAYGLTAQGTAGATYGLAAQGTAGAAYGLTAQGTAGAAYGLTAQGTAGAAYGLTAQGTAGAAYGLTAQGTAGAAYGLTAQGTAGAAYGLTAQGTAGAAYGLTAQGTAGAAYSLTAQGAAGATYALPQYAATRYITPGTGAVAAQPGSAVAYAAMPGQVSMTQAVYTNAAAAYTSTGGAVAYPAAAAMAGSAPTAIYADPYQQATLTPTAAALAAAYRGYRFAPY